MLFDGRITRLSPSNSERIAAMRTRFFYTVEKTRPSGTTYRHIVLIRDYYNEYWQSRSQVRRHFRNTLKRDYPSDWADPTGRIEVEEAR